MNEVQNLTENVISSKDVSYKHSQTVQLEKIVILITQYQSYCLFTVVNVFLIEQIFLVQSVASIPAFLKANICFVNWHFKK